MYKLAFRSNKPEADAFTNWVASEVLPSIRKTGKYETILTSKALPEAEPDVPQPPALIGNRFLEDCEIAAASLYEAARKIAEARDAVYWFRRPVTSGLRPGGILFEAIRIMELADHTVSVAQGMLSRHRMDEAARK